MLKIEFQNMLQAVEVVVDGFFQAGFRVGFQPKSLVATAGDGSVYAWVADSHSCTSFSIWSLVFKRFAFVPR